MAKYETPNRRGRQFDLDFKAALTKFRPPNSRYSSTIELLLSEPDCARAKVLVGRQFAAISNGLKIYEKQVVPPLDTQRFNPVIAASNRNEDYFGVSLVQTLHYYRSFDADRPQIKFPVASLIVLDVIHTLCIVHGTYRWYLQADLIFVLPEYAMTPSFNSLSTFVYLYIVQ